ncbi:MAG: hypothetical protein II359_03715, partial [Clostridia bacterium]|nr:hypothetical protein [Clostridia bacterium]
HTSLFIANRFGILHLIRQASLTPSPQGEGFHFSTTYNDCIIRMLNFTAQVRIKSGQKSVYPMP